MHCVCNRNNQILNIEIMTQLSFPWMIFAEFIEFNEVQNWYGYQEYPMSGICYILRGSIKNITFYYQTLLLDRYLFCVVSGDRCPPRGSKRKCLLCYYHWEYNCIQMGSTIGNHTTFGFCNHFLNSQNSVKFI